MPPAPAKRANYSRHAGKTSRLLVAALATGVLALASIVGAQPAPPKAITCAACHLSSAQAPGWAHVMEWEGSRHALAGVSCHDCHRGDPTGSAKAAAHVGMLKALHPNSPVRRAALPATCGQCHAGQLDAFLGSQHAAVLRELEARRADTRRVPTCATCHGSLGVRPAAQRVERECRSCHGAGGRRPRFDRTAGIAIVMAQAQQLRVQLAAAGRLTSALGDPAKRRAADDAVSAAQSALTTALERLHRFDLTGTARDLDAAATHVGAAYAQILSVP